VKTKMSRQELDAIARRTAAAEDATEVAVSFEIVRSALSILRSSVLAPVAHEIGRKAEQALDQIQQGRGASPGLTVERVLEEGWSLVNQRDIAHGPQWRKGVRDFLGWIERQAGRAHGGSAKAIENCESCRWWAETRVTNAEDDPSLQPGLRLGVCGRGFGQPVGGWCCVADYEKRTAKVTP